MSSVGLPNGRYADAVVVVDKTSGQAIDTSAPAKVASPEDETFLGTLAQAGTVLKQYIGGWSSFVVEFSATAGSHSVIIEGNATGLDGDQWYAISGYPTDIANTGVVATRTVTTGYTSYVYPKRFPWIRARVSTYGGSGTVSVRLTVSDHDVSSLSYQLNLACNVNNNSATQANPYAALIAGASKLKNSITDFTSSVYTVPTYATGGQQSVIPYSVPEVTWQYTPPVGGISNSSTAVQIAAAAGSGVRNYLASLTLATDTLGTATEFVVLDGSTAIYRTKLLTTAMPVQQIVFPVPLRGTANTSMSIQTVTASTGGVYCSVSGYTAP